MSNRAAAQYEVLYPRIGLKNSAPSKLRLTSFRNTKDHPFFDFDRGARRQRALGLVPLAELVAHGVGDLRVLGIIRHLKCHHFGVTDVALGQFVFGTLDDDGDRFFGLSLAISAKLLISM